MFHLMTEPNADEVKSGKVREFTGDGSHKLAVPGLIGEPTTVRVGSIEIPGRVSATFPDNRLNGQHVTTDMALIKVDRDSHDVPVLLRSQRSNDGYWQKGVKVHVWGEWDDAKPTSTEAGKEAPKPDTDQRTNTEQVPNLAAEMRTKLEALTSAELAEAAKRADVKPGANKAETIERILAKLGE